MSLAPRVALLGNCHAGAIAAAIKAYNPDVQTMVVERESFFTQKGRDEAASKVATADKIIAVELPPWAGQFAGHQIGKEYSNATLVPTITFEGHFPDSIYLDPPALNIKLLTGHYHSRIVVAAFLSGRSPRQTKALFNPLVYAKLGYFNRFKMASDNLRSHLQNHDPALPDLVEKWSARGCFMHSLNHPKFWVMADVARYAMSKADIAITANPDLNAITDPLAHLSRFPVYPEIAQRLGFEGSFEFFGNGETFNLDVFIDSSFQIYGCLPRRLLMANAVQEASALLD